LATTLVTLGGPDQLPPPGGVGLGVGVGPQLPPPGGPTDTVTVFVAVPPQPVAVNV